MLKSTTTIQFVDPQTEESWELTVDNAKLHLGGSGWNLLTHGIRERKTALVIALLRYEFFSHLNYLKHHESEEYTAYMSGEFTREAGCGSHYGESNFFWSGVVEQLTENTYMDGLSTSDIIWFEQISAVCPASLKPNKLVGIHRETIESGNYSVGFLL